MKKIKENKILFCIIIAGIFTIAAKLIGLLFKGSKDSVFIDCVKEALFAVCSCMLLKWSKKGYILKKKSDGFGKGLLTGGFLFFLTGLSILKFFGNPDNIKNMTSVENLVFLILEALLIGITEEFVFRGAIQTTLYDYFGKDTKEGIYKSVLLTGVIFGLVHIANILSGVEVFGAITQAITAFSVGCFFGAVYYRSENIWTFVVLHAMLDFNGLKEAALLGQGSTIDVISNYATLGTTSVILTVLIYLGITSFILRKSKLRLSE